MIKRLWLVFSQTLAVLAAFYFMTEVLRPNWVPDLLRRPISQTATDAHPGQGFRLAAKRAMPAVVNIYTSKDIKIPPKHPFFDDPEIRKFFGENPENQDNNEDQDNPSSLGSGVIVSPDGLIVTNQHVVEAADEIEVSLKDGRSAKATVVGSDPETDLAVIRIKMDNLPSLSFAPVGSTQVGDVVLAIGNPFGVGQTVTMGIVSALGRNHVGINTFENFIQTDAAINPGNSGGALVDTQGNLVGINTAIYSRSGGSLGIGFAIPISTVQNVLNQIVRNGKVTRGYIGVEQQNINDDLAKAFKLPIAHGVIIAGIVKDAPADKAGLKVGDILLKIGGSEVTDTTEMLNLIAGMQPGETKKVELMRDGKKKTLEIVIGVRPKPRDFLPHQ